MGKTSEKTRSCLEDFDRRSEQGPFELLLQDRQVGILNHIREQCMKESGPIV